MCPVCPEIGTEENHFVRMLRLHTGGTRTENGVDAANPVADLPRGLENIIR